MTSGSDERDEVSGDDGFLARWSRRKLSAAVPRPPDENDASAKDPAAVEATASAEDPPREDLQSAPTAEPLDLSALPPVESITAETDLAPFLRPGVPLDLKNAALRQMWSADPAIRNFKGLQEYDWDFNSPDLPGFGAIGPDVDVRAMADRLMGNVRRIVAGADETPGAAPPDARPPNDNIEQNQNLAAALTPRDGAAKTGPAADPADFRPAPAHDEPRRDGPPDTTRADFSGPNKPELKFSNEKSAAVEQPAGETPGRRHGSALPR